VHSLGQLTDPDVWAAVLGRGWGEAHTPEFWIAVAKIIWINILLSGDNAVVIALACRGLPPRQRAWGLVFGAGVAVALRVIFTGVIASGWRCSTSRSNCCSPTLRMRHRPRRPSICGVRCVSSPSLT
jgi:hypothetical protein